MYVKGTAESPVLVTGCSTRNRDLPEKSVCRGEPCLPGRGRLTGRTGGQSGKEGGREHQKQERGMCRASGAAEHKGGSGTPCGRMWPE